MTSLWQKWIISTVFTGLTLLKLFAEVRTILLLPSQTLPSIFLSIFLTNSWANAQRDAYPYEVNDQTCWAPFKDTHRAFIRKAQNGFGWDWGPAYVYFSFFLLFQPPY